jgi:hypothetical protein
MSSVDKFIITCFIGLAVFCDAKIRIYFIGIEKIIPIK